MKRSFLKIGIIASPILFLLVGFVGVVKAEPYGWSPNVDNSWGGPPKCTDAKPDKAPILLQPNHPVLPKKAKAGEVVLYWHKVPGATSYNVYYGLSPKNYIFSAPDIGDTNNLVVRFLPNKKFYFAVQARKGCAASNMSNEWAVRPGAGGYIVLGAATGKTVKKVTTSQPSSNRTVTTILPTSVPPTSAPAVKGVETGPQQQEVVQPQQYTPPVAPKAAQPAKPKPKGFFETILSILFGK
jgi:hypothetical protein